MAAAQRLTDPAALRPRRAGAGTPGDVRVAVARRSLAWRVFLTNAVVLLGVFAFYVLSPATISRPVLASELLVLVAALSLSLVLNLVLLNRAFGPLDELRRTMHRVDPLAPGRRIRVVGGDAEVAELADAFNDMLDRMETERRESARRTLAAQEEERRRVARELHDELGQVLTGVLLLIDAAGKATDGAAQAAIEDAREAARDSIDEVRRIVRDLRPEALDDLGLASALAAMGTSFERHTGVSLERRVPRALPSLTPEQELVAYRVAQEALTNVARHAKATSAELVVDQPADQMRVIVRDDGRGFAGPAPPDGGIRGMRERALLVRGTVSVNSVEGRGTEVVLTLPVKRS
jgi:two-component system sensor histidine kinase UhpB